MLYLLLFITKNISYVPSFQKPENKTFTAVFHYVSILHSIIYDVQFLITKRSYGFLSVCLRGNKKARTLWEASGFSSNINKLNQGIIPALQLQNYINNLKYENIYLRALQIGYARKKANSSKQIQT